MKDVVDSVSYINVSLLTNSTIEGSVYKNVVNTSLKRRYEK
jgi:hypothetical protein